MLPPVGNEDLQFWWRETKQTPWEPCAIDSLTRTRPESCSWSRTTQRLSSQQDKVLITTSGDDSPKWAQSWGITTPCAFTLAERKMDHDDSMFSMKKHPILDLARQRLYGCSWCAFWVWKQVSPGFARTYTLESSHVVWKHMIKNIMRCFWCWTRRPSFGHRQSVYSCWVLGFRLLFQQNKCLSKHLSVKGGIDMVQMRWSCPIIFICLPDVTYHDPDTVELLNSLSFDSKVIFYTIPLALCDDVNILREIMIHVGRKSDTY